MAGEIRISVNEISPSYAELINPARLSREITKEISSADFQDQINKEIESTSHSIVKVAGQITITGDDDIGYYDSGLLTAKLAAHGSVDKLVEKALRVMDRFVRLRAMGHSSSYSTAMVFGSDRSGSRLHAIPTEISKRFPHADAERLKSVGSKKINGVLWHFYELNDGRYVWAYLVGLDDNGCPREINECRAPTTMAEK